MKSLLTILAFTFTTYTIQGKSIYHLENHPMTTLKDIAYGDLERNKFDIILPIEESAHALIIFIHGGGFIHGDKEQIYTKEEDINFFIKNNIAVASINYSYLKNNDSLGVKACINDVQRAIQYIRFHAREYNINKTRIGLFGISAGAGSSLYFAFNEDKGIAGDTTLLGESTRVACAAAFSTQATYNLLAWKRIVPYFGVVSRLKRHSFNSTVAHFYGYPSYKVFKSREKEITSKLDMLSMINAQAPPIFLANLKKEYFPWNNSIIEHHKNHAISVAKQLKKVGVDHQLYTHKEAKQEIMINTAFRNFMLQHLQQPL